MKFKHKQIVTITLESNSLPDLVRIANKYFLAKPKKSENDPEKDKDRYVSLSMTKENINPKEEEHYEEEEYQPTEEEIHNLS